MGCQQLTYQKNNFLKVVHRKNGQVQKKNVLDYFSFGMPMPNRNVEGNYRYKYQGQEKDLETGKEAFQLRLWDARIGRWLTTDPYGQFDSPYLGMGNDPVNGIDPDGGYKTKWARFWGWVGGGFKGSFYSDKNNSNPYKRYGIISPLKKEAGFNISFGDWKQEFKNDYLAEIRNQEFQEQYMTAYDSRLRAIASVFELSAPSAKVKVPSSFKIFSKTPAEKLVSQVPSHLNEAAQARHIIGHGLKTPIKSNSAASQLTESAAELLTKVHGNNIKNITKLSDNKFRVQFNEVIGLFKTQSGTLGTQGIRI